MKKSDLLLLYEALRSVKNLKGAKFNYSIAKNIALLRDEAEALYKTLEPQDEMIPYNKKRMELINKYGERDEHNNLIVDVVQKEYKVKNKKAFEKELDVVKEKYTAAIEAYEKQVEEYNVLVRDEIEIGLYMIRLEDVPDDIVTEQMVAISAIISQE